MNALFPVKNFMMVSDEEFQNQIVFAELQRYGAFYESLSRSVLSFASVGAWVICNIDSYLFSSIQGTLASNHNITRDGRIKMEQKSFACAADVILVVITVGWTSMELGRIVTNQI
jgi:hypothetical protein